MAVTEYTVCAHCSFAYHILSSYTYYIPLFKRIAACMDTSVHPVQPNASIELPHVASPLRDPPGLLVSP
jgi:hypothetical protein